MKRAFALAVVLFMMSAIVAAKDSDKNASQNSGTAQQAITKLEQDWANAMTSADTSAIQRIEAADYTFTDPQGNVSGKAQDISDLKSGELKMQALDLKDMKVRVLDGNTAVVTGVNYTKGTYKGKDITGQYRFTDVWEKRGGEWQAVASQLTRVAEQASASNK